MTLGDQGRLLREGGSSLEACKMAWEAWRLRVKVHTDWSRQGAPRLSPSQSISPGVNTFRQAQGQGRLGAMPLLSPATVPAPLLGCAQEESARAAFESHPGG